MGDTVLLKAEERLTLTSHWDPQWGVVGVHGPVLWLCEQQSGKLHVVIREKVKLMDPHINWDEIQPRPHRNQPPCSNRLCPQHYIATPSLGKASICRPRGGRTANSAAVTEDTHAPLPHAADIDIPLSPGSPTPSIHSGNSVASGPSSVIMDHHRTTPDINSPRGRMGSQTAKKFYAPKFAR